MVDMKMETSDDSQQGSDRAGQLGGDGTVYGSCEGPDALYVKLISSDGMEFIIKKEHALTSGTIKAMLSGPGKSESLTIKAFS